MLYGDDNVVMGEILEERVEEQPDGEQGADGDGGDSCLAQSTFSSNCRLRNVALSL